MSSGKWRPFCLGLNVLRLLHLPGAKESTPEHATQYEIERRTNNALNNFIHHKIEYSTRV